MAPCDPSQAVLFSCRLHIRNNVVIKQLSMSVASSDQSYMPELVVVVGGRTPRNLRELKEVRIPGYASLFCLCVCVCVFLVFLAVFLLLFHSVIMYNFLCFCDED